MKEFKSLIEFERFMLKRVEVIGLGKHAALNAAAAIIEKAAYEEIGTYQDAAGPYGGWPDLAERTQADRMRKGFEPDEPLLRTGELRMSIGRTVEGDKAVVGSTSDIMVYQEMGTPNAKHPIPPRPVLGLAAYRTKHEVQKVIGEAITAVFTGRRMPKPIWKNINDK